MNCKILILSVLSFVFLSTCQKNDDTLDSNPNIPNAVFDTGGLINTNLPQFNHMQFPGNTVVLNNNYGINGVVVYYAGGTNYSAFELSDPNHQINSCSNLTVSGIVASCNCNDNNAYEILNGTQNQGTTGAYTLKRYFVEANANIIRVFNN